MTTSLKTVPTFTFFQGDLEEMEMPINVNFYNGSIELEQGNQSITIVPKHFEELFKAIRKHKPEAEAWLEKH